jgi:hypothetical protein
MNRKTIPLLASGTFRLSAMSVMALVLSAGAALKPATATADLSIDFNSLPSSQGWQYVTLDPTVSENQIFSATTVDDPSPVPALYQDSFPGGFSGAGENAYQISGNSASTGSFKITVRAEVTQYGFDPSGPNFNNAFGFGFLIRGINGQAGVGITGGSTDPEGDPIPDIITLDSALPDKPVVFSGDNSGWHTYVLEGSLDPNGTYSLYRDNILLGSTTIRPDATTDNGLLMLGDLTGGGAAIAYIDEYSYVNVPEPASGSLLLIAGAAILMRRRRRQSA